MTQVALQERVGRYEWSELWWGTEEPPPVARRELACSLMCVWSVPRKAWPALLGTERGVFDCRLDALLTIYATIAIRVDRHRWLPHWLHLPKAGLGMRRPLDVMIAEGVEGMRAVLDLVCAEGVHGGRW